MSDISRRTLMMSGLAAAAGLQATTAAAALPSRPAVPADKLATDENFWRIIADQYDIVKEVVQLENGNWGSMARPVMFAYTRHLLRVNRDNSYYARREFKDDELKIRTRIAAALGAQVEEIALTRNATEALQALIGGYNQLKPGDSVLFADLDYDAMQSAMKWLKERRGVNVVQIAIPEPATYQSIIDTYAAALKANPRVRLMLLTHLGHRTGLVPPVKEIIALARQHQVDVILDSAHAWGQIDFRLDELDADFVGLNAQKWIGAPLGVGVMYVRRSRIDAIDPFMADESFPKDDVRTRVHSGTSNFAAFLSVIDALDFHEFIGTPAKEARLRYLRDLWAEPLRENKEWEILTPTDKRLYAGLTSFRRRGKTSIEDNVKLAKQLLEEAKVFTVYRAGVASGACVRATPSMFTSPEDVGKLLTALTSKSFR